MNEVAPWGITWARTSKANYKQIITNLSAELQRAREVIYMRDLLYNPCHEANKIIYSWQKK